MPSRYICPITYSAPCRARLGSGRHDFSCHMADGRITESERRVITVYDGVWGGLTRWAIVFLIIFVLFVLLMPYGTTTTCTTTPVC
jgi:hypothetical protein